MKLQDMFKAGINRRSLLKAAGLSSLGMSVWPMKAVWGKQTDQALPTEPRASWKTDAAGNRYFTHDTIRIDRVNSEGIIAAKMDWRWKQYRVREFDSHFHDWWIEEKSWYYDQLLAFFAGETDTMEIPNGGHHHPMLATYGRHFLRRGDNTDFHLNCAPKGLTICPKADQIAYINAEVDRIYATGRLPEDLFRLRQDLYKDKSLWYKDRFATLELYSGRPINDQDDQGNYGFDETKTFQNLIVNPMACLTYMSLYNTEGGEVYFDGVEGLTPTWTFKGFCRLVAFHNPDNSDYEQTMAQYINDAHARYHGGASDIALNMFFIVEQFNETPSYDPGRGKRAVPAYEYGSTVSRPASGSVFTAGRKMSREEKIALVRRLRVEV
jgi:hypothetical protein